MRNLKEAFLLDYNLYVLGSGLVAGLLGHNLFLFVATLGVEGLWLLFAGDSALFQRYLDSQRRLKQESDREARIGNLDYEAYRNAKALHALYIQLGEELRASNDASLVMSGDYAKLDQLLTSYVDLAYALQDLRKYPRFAGDLKKSLEGIDAQLAAKRTPEASKPYLRKARDLIEKRLTILTGLRAREQQIEGQMAVIDSTFRLMYDQFKLFRSTGTVNEQIDEVLQDVSALQAVLHTDLGEVTAVTQVGSETSAPQRSDTIQKKLW